MRSDEYSLDGRRLGLAILTALLAACGGGGSSDSAAPATQTPAFSSKEALGESLFSDTSLSLNRTQSCATCHNPEHAFIDDRLDGSTGQVRAVSLGDDGTSLGDRNSPTAAYALFSPTFQWGTHARINSQQPDYSGFLGGQFLDGRETDLKGQASGPPLNPVEMNMPDKSSVVARLRENADYEASFKALFGDGVFDDVDTAYAAMTEAIASFEQTSAFFAFDSKYDRSLRGEYTYDPLSKAAAGKSLFFSQQFTNCATCHQLHPNGHKQETFTGYEYHNIGVPVNENVRALNGKPLDFVDNGLRANPAVTDDAHKGKFKVPTLRNVAVTRPYMHNGVFKELKTVIQFYDHFLEGSTHTLNSETGATWANPEVPETVSTTELNDGRNLSDADVEALVCFLRTLTDARYESLIEGEEIDCGE